MKIFEKKHVEIYIRRIVVGWDKDGGVYVAMFITFGYDKAMV